MARIALCMITKNEAKIIERCLASVWKELSYWIICDTGSTDDTVDRIGRFMADKVPGEMFTCVKFKDFSQARNEALDIAREFTEDVDWFLLMDADMELMGSFPSGDLPADCEVITLPQAHPGGVKYPNCRLLRSDSKAKYVGVTHEILAVGGKVGHLDHPVLLDHGDGGSKGDKFPRDLKLLGQALRKEKDQGLRSRYLYYRAQTLQCMGRHRQAAVAYAKRVKEGLGGEEHWAAMYQRAECLRHLRDDGFEKAAWEAYNYDPRRAEVLYKLTVWHREHGRMDAALACCEMGMATTMPRNALFVEEWVYRVGFFEEMSRFGMHSQLQERKDRSRQATVALTTHPMADRQGALNRCVEVVPTIKDAGIEGAEFVRLRVPQLEDVVTNGTSKVCVVTGYVPIPDHPRSEAEYDRMGKKLKDACQGHCTFVEYRQGLESCWLHDHACAAEARHAIGDNPTKNTLDYHIVQHQKTSWLSRAAKEHSECDVFIWIDMGIFHQPKVSVKGIREFIDRATNEHGIAVPGCWDSKPDWNDERVNWRFCGSVLACHKNWVDSLHQAVKDVTLSRLERDGFVTWEVNDWAAAEDQLPIRWYKADHDDTMFTSYQNELAGIFNKHLTNKESEHGFASVYSPLLSDKRLQASAVLEVGIGTLTPGAPSSMHPHSISHLRGYRPGASLRAWKEWFPNAVVHGVDVQKDTQFTEERIVTHLADSREPGQLKGVIDAGPFDVIVDDGLHDPESQLATFRNLFPSLKDGGLYFIEDVDDERVRVIVEGLKQLCTSPIKAHRCRVNNLVAVGKPLAKDLEEVLRRHGTDKAANGYTPVYESIPRGQIKRVLEIGVGTMICGAHSSMYGHDLPGYRPGASLRAWREWFGAEVHGIDPQPDTSITEDGIQTHRLDSRDAAAAASLLRSQGRFDLVIDDGSHEPGDQLATLRNYLPLVRPGGWYVLEDVQHDSPVLTSSEVARVKHSVHRCHKGTVIVLRPSKKLKVHAVTSWTPGINTTLLKREQYVAFKDQLVKACDGRLTVLEPFPFEDIWLVKEGHPKKAANRRAADRYPTDTDHLKGNVIQHARTQAAMEVYAKHPDADVIVWLDYGVMKQGAWNGNPVQEQHIREFLERIEAWEDPDCIPFPGIEQKKPVDVHGDNWRFCGSTHIWPTRFLPAIDAVYRKECRAFIDKHKCVPLDLAIWPAVEANGGLPFRWYKAEYDCTQFTNLCTEKYRKILNDYGRGPDWRRERDLLVALARCMDGDVLEIGTNRGETAAYLGQSLPEKTVWTVDGIDPSELCEAQRVERLPDALIGHVAKEVPNVHQMFGDSKTMTYPSNLGLVFIDGDHTESGVLADTNRTLEYGRKRGKFVIAWHDYGSASPWAVVKKVLDSLKLSVTHWPGTMIATMTMGDVDLSSVSTKQEERWLSSSPSVCVVGDDLRCMVRAVNYEFVPERTWYIPMDGGDVIRTKNYLCKLDPDTLEVKESRECLDKTEGACPSFPSGKIRGFEDLRLFRFQGSLWASGTVCDRDADGLPRYCVVQMDGQGDFVALSVNRHVESGKAQKNWMPVAQERSLRFVYSCGPTAIVNWTRWPPTVAEVYQSKSHDLSALRGSSQLVPIADGEWLAVTHEVAFGANGRSYLHRFVRFDRDLHVKAITEPFCFRYRGVEFCCGLASWKGKLLVSFSVLDRESWVLRMPWEALNQFQWEGVR